MSKQYAFVISDVHGQYNQLVQLLNYWNPETQELIINGDLVDRGKDSAKVLQQCYALMLEGHTVLRGNHDQMLIDFLTVPETELADMYITWYFQGGKQTSDSILNKESTTLSPIELKKAILAQSYVLDTLELTEHYYVWHNVLFVHAGISPIYQEDWEKAPKSDMLWTRDCYKYPNKTGKVIVSGHTPVRLIHGKDLVWVNKDQNIVMIDGASAYGGQLNGVVLDTSGKVVQTYIAK